MTEHSPDTSLFTHTIRVFYEDTDASGVVYHADYLRYFERARTLWLESLGLTHTRLAEELDTGFVVTHAELDYRQPARLDDRLNVTVAVSGRRRASLVFEQVVWRDSTIIVKGQFTVACVKLSRLAPCALPEAIRNVTGAANKEHQ